MLCQCRLICGKIKCTILVSDVDNEGDYACVGTWGMGNLCLPLNFVVNLKPLLKKSLKK